MKKKIGVIILIILILLIIAGFLIYKIYTNNQHSEYTCPDSEEYINCMPILSDSEAEYCSWVEDNCPNVNIAY